MKLEKGLTLSQFVDLMSVEKVTDTRSIMFGLDTEFKLVERYNSFLKQPLKKEMFVNEIEEPDESKYLEVLGGMNGQASYDTDLNLWQEAEKKVIFKGLRLKGKGMDLVDVKIKKQTLVSFNKTELFSHYKTLSDLFQAIPDLTLQNVDI